MLGAVAVAGSIVAGQNHPNPRLATVRLVTPVSANASRIGDPVTAVAIGLPGEDLPIPPGCLVTGHVAKAQSQGRDRQGRQVLHLRFDAVRDRGGVQHAADLRVAAVDNARETIDGDGAIVGLAPVHARPTKLEALLMLAAHAHPMALAAEEAVRLGVKITEREDIEFTEGVNMTLAVGASPDLSTLACPGSTISEAPPDTATSAWAQALPVRAQAGVPPRAADWINVAAFGTADALAAAFARAGWSGADGLSLRADVRTFVAVVERSGYRTGPFSRLTLDGAGPALVFQKQTNTFAKRHHVRFWPAQGRAPDGRVAWVGAATHDVGLEFSHQTRHYTHRIDGAIDDERRSLLTDLIVADAVTSFSFVSRAAIPRQSTNATGDPVTTDGRLVVVSLREPAASAAVPPRKIAR